MEGRGGRETEGPSFTGTNRTGGRKGNCGSEEIRKASPLKVVTQGPVTFCFIGNKLLYPQADLRGFWSRTFLTFLLPAAELDMSQLPRERNPSTRAWERAEAPTRGVSTALSSLAV